MTDQSKTESKSTGHPIHLTDGAITKALASMKAEGKNGWGLKISVKIGGCAGYTYLLSFEEHPLDNDEILQMAELKVFVDKNALRLIKGITVDYLDSLNESGFKFINPNAKTTCGCGTSFS